LPADSILFCWFEVQYQRIKPIVHHINPVLMIDAPSLSSNHKPIT